MDNTVEVQARAFGDPTRIVNDTPVAVTELFSYNPNKVGCRLRIRPDDEGAHARPTLALCDCGRSR